MGHMPTQRMHSSDRACDIAVAVHLKRTASRVRFCPLRLASIVLIQHSCSNNCKFVQTRCVMDCRTGAMMMNH